MEITPSASTNSSKETPYLHMRGDYSEKNGTDIDVYALPPHAWRSLLPAKKSRNGSVLTSTYVEITLTVFPAFMSLIS